MAISSNLTYAGDVLQVGNLLFGSIEVLTQNPSLYQQSSYMVSYFMVKPKFYHSTVMVCSTQNLVTVASDLLDVDNIELWLDLNQVLHYALYNVTILL